MPDDKKVHLVLSGGGVKCISYAGAIATLSQRGFSFASVSAVSAGTFIGAWVCAGVEPEAIEETIIETDLSRIVGGRPRPTSGIRRWLPVFRQWWRYPFALYQQERLVEYFNQLVDPGLTLGQLRIPFATAGIDLINDRILVYSKESHPAMPAAEAVRIAMALPLLFPPHRSERRIVVDASLASQSPVWLASNADALPIVVLKPTKRQDLEPPATLDAYITRMIESGVGSRDHYILSQMPRVHVIEIKADDVRFDQFDLSREQRRGLINRGEDAAAREIPRIGEQRPAPHPRRRLGRTGSVDQRAEQYGEEKMRAFVGNLSTQVRNRVFISYSRRDEEWLKQLQVGLRPYVRNEAITVWDDTHIAPGMRWREEIQKALQNTKVAVLLVTPDFIASDFIVEEELAYFLHTQETEGLVILWVAVSAGAYDQVKLTEIQAANDPQRPLDMMEQGERNRALDQICKQVHRALS
jgi:predicted acylesterase/phospholipase RssA